VWTLIALILVVTGETIHRWYVSRKEQKARDKWLEEVKKMLGRNDGS